MLADIPQQFAILKSRGLLNLESVNDRDNELILCPTCHRNFDDYLDPGFLFVPSNLQFFKEAEREDMERRHRIRRENGRAVARAPPTAEAYLQAQIRAGTSLAGASGGSYDHTPSETSFQSFLIVTVPAQGLESSSTPRLGMEIPWPLCDEFGRP